MDVLSWKFNLSTIKVSVKLKMSAISFLEGDKADRGPYVEYSFCLDSDQFLASHQLQGGPPALVCSLYFFDNLVLGVNELYGANPALPVSDSQRSDRSVLSQLQ